MEELQVKAVGIFNLSAFYPAYSFSLTTFGKVL